jgi:hypothetical protein
VMVLDYGWIQDRFDQGLLVYVVLEPVTTEHLDLKSGENIQGS